MYNDLTWGWHTPRPWQPGDQEWWRSPRGQAPWPRGAGGSSAEVQLPGLAWGGRASGNPSGAGAEAGGQSPGDNLRSNMVTTTRSLIISHQKPGAFPVTRKPVTALCRISPYLLSFQGWLCVRVSRKITFYLRRTKRQVIPIVCIMPLLWVDSLTYLIKYPRCHWTQPANS